jgi:diguanylate cyclase (GGDEF)-like protein/PAS domain S-box-containing protein
MSKYEHVDREDLVRLLTRAEQTLRAESDDDARRRLHELELHQIELELSNRELAAAQTELEVSREQSAVLFDFAPVAYLQLDLNGNISRSNLAAARLLRRERGLLDGWPLASILGGQERSHLLSHLNAAFAGKGLVSDEFQLEARRQERARELRLDSCVMTDADGSHHCLTTLTDITELHQAQQRLRRSNQELKTLLKAAPVGIGVVCERVFQSVNQRLLALLGYSEEELIGQSARMIYPNTAEFERVARVKHAQVRAYGVGEIEAVMRRRDGTLVDVLLRSAALDPADLRAGLVFTVLDITDRKRAERERDLAQQLLDQALEGGQIGTYSARMPEGAFEVDARYLAMLGYRPGELRLDWHTWLEMIHPEDRAAVEARVKPVIDGEVDSFEAEYRMRHRSGHWVWVLDRSRVHDRKTDRAGLQTAGTHLDITRRREAEGQVMYLVEHDAATDVLNRRGIMRSIQTIHGQAKRSGQPFAIAILDLDHFKEINDAYGHLAGDAVLHRAGEMLRHELRSADWVGRWGGDEFILVIPDSSAATAMATIERVRARIGAEPIDAAGHAVRLSISAGLALFRPGADSLEAVIQRADAALYQAKRRGRNRALFDGAEEGQAAISRAAVLQEALREETIEVCERPILALRSGRQRARELVAQVPHPAGGLLDEQGCIEVAQQLGLMHRIDQILVTAAAERLAAAPPEEAGQDECLVFVRLSRDSVLHPSYMEALAERVPADRSGHSDPGLVLTVDEAQFAQGAKQVLAGLQPLLERGCKLGVVGFGGQQSTIRFLVELPVAFVIVDAELMRLAAESPRARTALVCMTQTARDMGCTVIARQDGEAASPESVASWGIDWVQ